MLKHTIQKNNAKHKTRNTKLNTQHEQHTTKYQKTKHTIRNTQYENTRLKTQD